VSNFHLAEGLDDNALLKFTNGRIAGARERDSDSISIGIEEGDWILLTAMHSDPTRPRHRLSSRALKQFECYAAKIPQTENNDTLIGPLG
jgi:hypothetical protein